MRLPTNLLSDITPAPVFVPLSSDNVIRSTFYWYPIVTNLQASLTLLVHLTLTVIGPTPPITLLVQTSLIVFE